MTSSLSARPTPGPWEFDGNCGGYITQAGDKIARAYCQADARAIAALPALIEALTGLIKTAEDHNAVRSESGCNWDFGDGFGGSLDKARAALTQALGE